MRPFDSIGIRMLPDPCVLPMSGITWNNTKLAIFTEDHSYYVPEEGIWQPIKRQTRALQIASAVITQERIRNL